MIIYILSSYEEHGAERLIAVSKKEDVEQRMKLNWPEWSDLSYEQKQLNLALGENNPGKYGLSDGWGGIQLHIVELK